MKDNICPSCGGEASLFFETEDHNQRLSEELFSYFRCHQCGFIYLENIPADLGSFYPDGYHYFPKNEVEIAACAEHERYKIDIVKKYKSSGSLVEIGPSWGAFSWLAKQTGFDVTAIEMNPLCCTYLSDVIGVNVLESSDEVESLTSVSNVDVIALWHVIEHVRRPWELIRAASNSLKEDGILILAAPNPNAFQLKVLKSRWVHIDAPRHVTQLTPDFIESVAADAGLECVAVTTRDKGSLGWNSFGWEYSLMNMFHMPLLRRVAFFTGKIIALFAQVVESREGKGSAYTIVLKKRVQ